MTDAPMKTLQAPTARNQVARHSPVRFRFDSDSIAPTGRYQVRGGITWPMLLEDGTVQGAAVVAARHEPTSRIFLFEQTTFQTIDHVIYRNGRIKSEGLCEWFNRMSAEYLCRSYYWNHPDAKAKQVFTQQVRRSPIIEPKPSFPRLEWYDETVIHRLYELEQTHKLIYSSGPFALEWAERAIEPDGVYPAVHAALCAVTGLDRRQITETEEPALEEV